MIRFECGVVKTLFYCLAGDGRLETANVGLNEMRELVRRILTFHQSLGEAALAHKQ